MEDVGGGNYTNKGNSEQQEANTSTAVISQQIKQDQSGTSHSQVGDTEGKRRRGYFRELCSAGPDRHIELLLTIAIATFACFQLIITCSNNKSTSAQSQRLLDTANRMDDAADSFSSSASHINQGVSDAVGDLKLQAGAMNHSAQQASRLASASEEANRMAKVTLEAQVSANRPILDVGGFDDIKVDAKKAAFSLRIANTGPTPALNINYVIGGPHDAKWDSGDHREMIERQTSKSGIVVSDPLVAGHVPDIIGHASADDPVEVQVPIRNYALMSLLDDGSFYYGKLDFDGLYGDKWERTFCIMIDPWKVTITPPPVFAKIVSFRVTDCNLREERLQRRVDNPTKESSRKPRPNS
jgi:hypothetical protein